MTHCGICIRAGKEVDAPFKVGEEFPSRMDLTCVICKAPSFSKHLAKSAQTTGHTYFPASRHNLTQHVCRDCFLMIMGPMVDKLFTDEYPYGIGKEES